MPRFASVDLDANLAAAFAFITVELLNHDVVLVVQVESQLQFAFLVGFNLSLIVSGVFLVTQEHPLTL